MTKYKVTYTFEANSPEEASQKVLTSFYLAQIEADTVKIEQVVDGGEVFSYPHLQKLLRHLDEEKGRALRRPTGGSSPAAEGDWQLYNGTDRVGEDTE